jgi:hypothetical protein
MHLPQRLARGELRPVQPLLEVPQPELGRLRQPQRVLLRELRQRHRGPVQQSPFEQPHRGVQLLRWAIITDRLFSPI